MDVVIFFDVITNFTVLSFTDYEMHGCTATKMPKLTTLADKISKTN